MQWNGFKGLRTYDEPLNSDLRELERYIREMAGRLATLFSEEPTSTSASTAAPADASYVVVSSDPTLTDERVLTAGTHISLTDGGANTTETVAVTTNDAWTLSGGVTVSTSALTMNGANIVMGDNSITGIDTLTFTDTAGTIAGIQNQNLLDKTAVETITGGWTFGVTTTSFGDDSAIVDGRIRLYNSTSDTWLTLKTTEIAGMSAWSLTLPPDAGSGNELLSSGGGTTDWLDIQGVAWTFTQTETFNAGAALGNGVLQSADVDAAGSPAFYLEATQTRSTDDVLQLYNSADSKYFMDVSPDGEFGFGKSSSSLYQSGWVLGFLATTAGVGKAMNGAILGYMSKDSAVSPTLGEGVRGQVSITDSTGAGGYNPAGVVAIFTGGPDATGFSGTECASLIAGSIGSVSDPLAVGTSSIKGDFDRYSALRAVYAKTHNTSVTNKPPISTSLYAPIQGVSSSEQWGVETTGYRSGLVAQQTTPTTAGAIKVGFPQRFSSHGAHMFFADAGGNRVDSALGGYAASAGGPTCSQKGGVYFDDGTSNLVGLYEHDGTNWLKLVSQNRSSVTTITQTYSTATTTHANPTGLALTDSTGGSADQTLSAVTDQSETTDNSVINDNFAELADEVNKIITDLANTKQVLNQVVDELQAINVVA